MKKILFVDDEPNVLAAFQRQLRRQFEIETAPGPREGLAALQNPADYAVVVADMRMPEMNGVEFLIQVKAIAPDIVRMMLTGNADQGTAIDAINQGNIFRFLNKPCSTEKITEAVEAALRQHELITAERDLLENTLNGSVRALVEILAVTDPKLSCHTEIVRDQMRELAQFLKLENAWQYETAALLSRIGTVTIPAEVLLKVRVHYKLTPKEQEMIDRVPAVGSNLIAQIPRLDKVAKIVLYQNKRFDGSGFPADNLCGRDIPLGSRLLKILFDLAEMEKEGTTRLEALQLMRDLPGWYDPELIDSVGACLKIALPQHAERKPPLPVNFTSLHVGHVLVSDIETREGIMIVGKGNRITPALIQRLRNFEALSGVKEPIYVEA